MSRPMKDFKLGQQEPKSIPNDPFKCVKPNKPSMPMTQPCLDGMPKKPHPFRKSEL